MPKAIDLSQHSLDELNAHIEEATKLRDERVDTRRAELMAELEKLGGIPKPTARPRLPAGLKDGQDARKKPEPIYQTPAGETWTGRGNLPKFFKALGAKSKADLEQYRIKR